MQEVVNMVSIIFTTPLLWYNFILIDLMGIYLIMFDDFIYQEYFKSETPCLGNCIFITASPFLIFTHSGDV